MSESFEKIEKYVQSVMVEKSLVSSSVAVVKGDEVVWSKGFGSANISKDIPATPETIYRCASVTKPVVTVGLLQWMERGKFNLDDPVNEYLNAKIKTEYAIQPTFRDLLTHYSGLPQHIAPMYYDRSEALKIEDWINKIAKVVRPPKQVYTYANIGFDIVGYLIEIFSGVSYDVYMKEKIFDPLEMGSSTFDAISSTNENLTWGYERDGPKGTIRPVKPHLIGTLPEPGSAGMFSTCIDLAHFVISQMNGGVYKGNRILKPKTLKEMQKLQMSTGISRNGIGLTWDRYYHYDHVILKHTGGVVGVANHLAFYPDSRLGIVWLSNLQEGSGWRPPAPAALRIISGEYNEFNPKTIQKNIIPDKWFKIAGDYDKEGKKQAIKIENGYLVIDEKENKIYLEEKEEDRFLIHGGLNDGLEMTFEYDSRGRVKQYDLETNITSRYFIGSWFINYTTNPELNDSILEIDSETHATYIDMNKEEMYIQDFTNDDNKITGNFEYNPPQEYRGWQVFHGKDLQCYIELLYIKNELQGKFTLARKDDPDKKQIISVTYLRK
jgi:CubicO group peptidase (beta-lactamase class C family)